MRGPVFSVAALLAAALHGVAQAQTADAQFVANLAAEAGLQSAWITNGLHTSRIPASAFELFTAS